MDYGFQGGNYPQGGGYPQQAYATGYGYAAPPQEPQVVGFVDAYGYGPGGGAARVGANGLLLPPEAAAEKPHEAAQFLRLNPTEEQTYGQLWHEASNGDDKAPAKRAAGVLGRAEHLSRSQLRMVWNICDAGSKGFLRRDEFFIALRLIALAQRGAEPSVQGLRNFVGIQLVPKMNAAQPVTAAAPAALAAPAAPAAPQAPQQTQPPPVNGAGSAAPNASLWVISKQQNQKYESMFAKTDMRGSGFVTGPQAVELFQKSGLPRPLLRQVWALADVTEDGRLDFAEFRNAIHLIKLLREKRVLPKALPSRLDPAGLNWVQVEGEQVSATRADASLPTTAREIALPTAGAPAAAPGNLGAEFGLDLGNQLPNQGNLNMPAAPGAQMAPAQGQSGAPMVPPGQWQPPPPHHPDAPPAPPPPPGGPPGAPPPPPPPGTPGAWTQAPVTPAPPAPPPPPPPPAPPAPAAHAMPENAGQEYAQHEAAAPSAAPSMDELQMRTQEMHLGPGALNAAGEQQFGPGPVRPSRAPDNATGAPDAGVGSGEPRVGGSAVPTRNRAPKTPEHLSGAWPGEPVAAPLASPSAPTPTSVPTRGAKPEARAPLEYTVEDTDDSGDDFWGPSAAPPLQAPSPGMPDFNAAGAPFQPAAAPPGMPDFSATGAPFQPAAAAPGMPDFNATGATYEPAAASMPQPAGAGVGTGVGTGATDFGFVNPPQDAAKAPDASGGEPPIQRMNSDEFDEWGF